MALPSLNAPPQLLWLCLIWPLLWWLAQPPRPRRVLISAHRTQWLLAQRALGRRPQRFRAWRWLLASAAAGLCVLAVAAPAWPPTDGPRRLVVLLDASASMARQAAGGTAMAHAIATAKRELAGVPAGIAVELVVFGGGSFGRWSGAAARALAMTVVPAGELPAPLAELAATALREPATAVWVLSDGQDVATLPTGATLTRVGSVAPNAAIAHVEVVDRWPLADLQVAVRVRSCADVPLQGVLVLDGAIGAAAEQPVVLAPDEERTLPFAVQRRREGGELRLQLRLAGDALDVDDAWQAQLAPLPELKIALAADGDARLAQGAAAALAEAVGGEVVAAAAGQRAGFLLAEGGRAELPTGGAPLIAFGVAGAGDVEPWPAPLLVDWARDEPLLAGLDFSELRIDQALAGALPPGRTLLLGGRQDGSTAPLMVLATAPTGAAVHCAFRLADSNFGLLPALPQLLLRTWRAGYAAADAATVTPGPTVPAAESDLRRGAADLGPSGLPAFGLPAEDLGPWCLVMALLLLALRAGIR